MRWNIGGTASGIQKMVFSQRTFNRACAFIVINKVWCFSHVWWYFFPSKDDLYLHIGMGFFSWWRVFGGCYECRGWASMVYQSVSQDWAQSPSADGSWSCHPKSHSLISCLFSTSLAPTPATPSVIYGASRCKG